MKVSVVVLTKNEEDRIAKCLESVNWADEVIVIDDYSEDRTREIARKMGARVYKRRLASLGSSPSYNFAEQRNYGLEKARGEWVLFVDADEVVSDKLAKEIIVFLPTSDDSLRETSDVYRGFKIRRVDYMWGKKLRFGEVGDFRVVRLGKKNAGKWKRKVHETWKIRGKIGEIGGEIKHYPHPNVAQFLETIRKYSLLHAQALQKEGVKTSLFQILAFPAGKFLANFLLKFGFLDGTAGFVHALMMSFHSFLARSELWLWQRKNI